ncbi:hemerythrin domain-containing protein [Aurantivibrio plasticivorans]
MHPALSQLYADHFNFIRLLQCLDAEVTRYEEAHSEHARLPLILDIIECFRVYPEGYHHPLEDLAIESLLKKNLPQSEKLWRMRAEHHQLEKLSQRAENVFNAVANDTVVSIDDLVTAGREYTERQIEHIHFENMEVYPLFERFVMDKDWDNMTSRIEGASDPVFSAAVKGEFASLYRSIIQTGQAEGRSVHARGFSRLERVSQ